MQLHLSVRPTKQKGAFLVIATILLLVLSSLGVALMSMAISASRTSRNYSDYVTAHIRAISMAGYAQRIIESFTEGQYPGPGTCSTSGTCNQIDSTFPRNGRPVLPWDVGTMTATMFKGSESSNWWNTNGFEYESAFAGSGEARIVVSLLNSSSTYPYTNTYKIVGYSTDNNGMAPSTSELYTTWNGFRPDPGNGSGTSCYFGQCSADNSTCETTDTTCNSSVATYVPPGWSCSDYFVTGLGFNSSTCDNPRAKTYEALNIAEPSIESIISYYKTNGSFPELYNNKTYIPSTGAGPVEYVYAWKGCSGYVGDCMQVMAILRNGVIPPPDGRNPSSTPGIGNGVLTMIFGNVGGVIKIYCGSDQRSELNTLIDYIPFGCYEDLYGDSGVLSGIPD